MNLPTGRWPEGKCDQGLFWMKEGDFTVVVPSDTYYKTIFDDREVPGYDTGFWMLNYYPIR